MILKRINFFERGGKPQFWKLKDGYRKLNFLDTSMFYKKNIFIAFGVFFLLIAYPSSAWAYLDPGAGSYLFQVLISSLLAMIFVGKIYWKNLKNFVRNKLFRRKK